MIHHKNHVLKIAWMGILFLGIFLAPVFAQSVSSPPSASESPATEEESLTIREKKDQDGYIVNLKDLIQESKKKIEKVNDKIKEQAILRRNQQREERMRGYYQDAMRLFEEGKLEEAQNYWRKAIKVSEHPEMKGYIHKSVKKTKKQEAALKEEDDLRLRMLEIERGYSAKDVEETYQTGVSLFKQKKFLAAKEDFDRVEEMFPDHKATRSYLMVIEQEIQKEQQAIIEHKLKEEAITREKEKEAWRKQLEAKENQRQDELQKQAGDLYDQAVKLYKVRQFETAKEKSKEVEWMYPGFRSTLKYLSHIDDDIKNEKKRLEREQERSKVVHVQEEQLNKERQEGLKVKQARDEENARVKRLKDEADFVYNAAVSLYDKGLFKQAREKFDEVQKISPDYKVTSKYLSRIEGKIENLDAAEKEIQVRELALRIKDERLTQSRKEQEQKKKDRRVVKPKAPPIQDPAELEKLKKEIDKVYKEALDLFKKKQMDLSEEKFFQLEELLVSGSFTEDYLHKIKQRLDRDRSRIQKQVDQERSREEREIARKIQKEEKKNRGLKRKDLSVKVRPEEKKTPGAALIQDENSYVQSAVEQRQKKFSDEAQQKYARAVEFYTSGHFVEAKRKLIEVEALYPGYKKTSDYLSRIDEDIAKISEAVKKEDCCKDKKSSVPKRTAAPIAFKSALAHFQDEAEEIYQYALKLFKTGQYEKAKDKFIEADHLIPGYKSTGNYIQQIEKKIDRRQQEISERDRQGAKNREKENRRLVQTQQKELETQRHRARLEQKILTQAREQKLREKKQLEGLVKKQDAEVRKQLEKEKKDALQRLRRGDQELKEAIDLESKARAKEAKDSTRLLAEVDQMGHYPPPEKVIRDAEEEKRSLFVLKSIKQEKKEKESRRKKEEKELKKKARAEELARIKKEKQIRAERWTQPKKQLNKEKKVAGLKKEKTDRTVVREKDSPEEMGPSKDQKFTPEDGKLDEKATRDHELRQTPVFAERDKAQRLLKAVRANEERVKQNQKKFWNQKQREIKKAVLLRRAEEDKELRQHVAVLYDEAVQSYKEGDYLGAKTQFANIDVLYPKYKSTRFFMERSDRNMMKGQDLTVDTYSEGAKDQQRILEQAKKTVELQDQQRIPMGKDFEKDEEFDGRRLKEKKIEEKKLEKRQREISQKEIGQVYEEVIDLYKAKKFKLVEERSQRFEELLQKSHLGVKLTEKWRRRLRNEQTRIQRQFDKERRKSEVISQKREEEFSREEAALKEKRPLSLEQLEPKPVESHEEIVAQETVTTKESKPMIVALEEKEEIKEKSDEDPEDRQRVMERRQEELLLRGNRKELERLIRQRQRELKAERESIRREFNGRLRQLYEKAVKLHQSSQWEEARKIFQEIDNLQPEYKASRKYLNRIDEQIKKTGQQGSNSKTVEQKQTSRMEKSSSKPGVDSDLKQTLPTPSSHDLQKPRRDLVAEALDAVEKK